METEIKKYIEWKATYAPRAAVNYVIPLERFKKMVHKDLSRVRLDDIVRFQNMVQDRYSPTSAAFAIIVLKNFFKFWKVQGKDVIDPYLIRIPRFTPKSHSAISCDDFRRMDELLDATEFYGLEKKVIVNLLWETGVRVSELCDLDVLHVDVQRRKALIVTKKNKKQRWIIWSEKTHGILLKYLGIRICLNQQPALFIASEIGGRRERVSVRTVQRWVTEIARGAGILKKVSPHSFRHGKAHRILDLGGNPKHVQAILGHSENNPVTAFSYLRLNETEFEKIADQFLQKSGP